MTKLNFNKGTLTDLEELSVKDLKDMIKEHSETTGVKLPVGMWKMTRDELITELEDIYTDFIDEDSETETEKVAEKTEDQVEEKTETTVKPAESKEPKTTRGARTKKVRMTNHETNEEIIFDKADDAHKWLKANHGLGYSHIKQSCEGKQTKKLDALNITFEWVKED